MAELLRADFPKLYASRLAYLRMLIGPDEWPEVDNQWQNYFTVLPSSKMKEEMLMWGGLGFFQEMTENDPVTYDNLVQGPSKVFQHLLYGLGFSIGFLAAKHDLDGLIAKYAPELGRSMRMSVQTLAASFWNNAFGTSLTADGLAYFSTAHTYLRGGGTWANRPTTGATLGAGTLETAMIAFSRQTDLMGNPMPLPFSRLVVPPELYPIATELCGAQKVPESNFNEPNFAYGKVTPEQWPFLTTTTAWMLLGPQKNMKVYWFWNIKPDTTHGYDFDREAAKTKTLFAASYGAVDARGSWGNPGV